MISPLFWALLASIGMSALMAIGWIAALDRADARRARPKLPVIGRDVSLPTAIALPTAHRRKHPGAWS